MNIKKTMLALAGAAALATGAFADGPSITLNRVQQRYPWNGMVDIDYEVNLADGNPVWGVKLQRKREAILHSSFPPPAEGGTVFKS